MDDKIYLISCKKISKLLLYFEILCDLCSNNDTFFSFQLPPNTTWQVLRDKCQDIGEVKFAEMRGTDLGMVRFASEWDAERAVCILFYNVQIAHFSLSRFLILIHYSFRVPHENLGANTVTV